MSSRSSAAPSAAASPSGTSTAGVDRGLGASCSEKPTATGPQPIAWRAAGARIPGRRWGRRRPPRPRRGRPGRRCRRSRARGRGRPVPRAGPAPTRRTSPAGRRPRGRRRGRGAAAGSPPPDGGGPCAARRCPPRGGRGGADRAPEGGLHHRPLRRPVPRLDPVRDHVDPAGLDPRDPLAVGGGGAARGDDRVGAAEQPHPRDGGAGVTSTSSRGGGRG